MFIVSSSTLVGAVLLYYGCLWYWSSTRLRRRGLQLPPGPKRKFITGNLHQIPKFHPYLTFRSWALEYGPIVYLQVFNSKTIVLNSARAALDLLESRSAIYSDRPRLWMAELSGGQKSVFITSFANPRFKILRRLLQTGLNSRAAKGYRPIQERETQTLLRNLTNAPEQFMSHIRRNAVAIILKVAYGYQVESNDDPLVVLIETSFKLAATINVPGKFWVEFFPILRYLPEWIPGAGFKKLAREVGKERSKVNQVPYIWARKEIEKGDFVESFVSKHTLRAEGGDEVDQDTLDAVRWTAAALYVGGGDTTVSALTSFMYLMAIHPDIQKRAQADVDQVTQGRLPTLDDYESLPFIKAIIKEVLRWAPVAPLGIPHRVMEDDVYQSYFIPKGARIVANIWAITHDEEAYPDPFKFDPSRFVGSSPQPDPFKFVFGFGRRICPGAHLAEMSLFLSIANILAVFNISKPLDENGKEFEPEIDWTSGTTRHLKPFPCQIKPRSKEHLLLLG